MISSVLKKPALALISCAGRWWLRSKGVIIGRDAWVLGFPDVKIAVGSRIVLGDSVSLLSARWANPLRPSRRASLVTLMSGAEILIGNEAGISSSVISCAASIRIGDRTLIGSECIIVDSDFHPVPPASTNQIVTRPVVIGNDVFIGTRSVILKGVTIGDRSVVGAGSVVTKDIPPGCIAAGNPARVVRTLTVGQAN